MLIIYQRHFSTGKDGVNYVGFEVFTAVTTNNGVFWDVTPFGSVRTDVSEELSSSFIRVTIINELSTSAVTSNRRKLRRNTK
jgi:hypothetical protein